MGIPSDTLKAMDDATDRMLAEICRLYVVEGLNMQQVAYRVKEPLCVVSKYLNAKGLKRSSREIARRGPWRGDNQAKFEENRAKYRARGDAE